MYLLDTDVLSELRRSRRNSNVTKWIVDIAPDDLFLSVITISEIELGIERQRPLNPGFAQNLSDWLDITLRVYGERILPLTIGIARRWGRLAAQLGNKQLDLAIASTALEHDLTVVTRNVSDFEPTGVSILNPFDTLPPRKR
jgi:predicted nucleic acid-binding protein